jgi:hypothetical protein
MKLFNKLKTNLIKLILVSIFAVSLTSTSNQVRSFVSIVKNATLDFNLPENLLFAIIYSESHFSLKGKQQWIAKKPTIIKVLAKYDQDPNISPELGVRWSAILLEVLASKAGISKDSPLQKWRPILESFSERPDPLANALYAEEILNLMAGGFGGFDDEGNWLQFSGSGERSPSHVLRERSTIDVVGASYAPYYEASKLAHRPLPETPRKVNYIIIHTMEGIFPHVFDYFRRKNTNVAAHYIVRASDGFTVQLVDERIVSFHDACFNEESIGIELEGFTAAGKQWYTKELYQNAARLVRDIAARHNIPLDREHILGHGEAPDCSDHTDPGEQWDWNLFMSYIQEQTEGEK